MTNTNTTKTDIEVYRMWIVHCEDCGIIETDPTINKAQAIEIKKEHFLENHAPTFKNDPIAWGLNQGMAGFTPEFGKPVRMV